MTRKVRRWWHMCGSLTVVLCVVCAAGWIGLAITGHIVDLLRATMLLAGMMACTRIAIARQRRTSETVTDSLEHFQQLDKSIADRVLEDAVLRLAESGQIVVAGELRPPASVNNRRLWRPPALPTHYGEADDTLTNVVQLRSRISEAS